MTTVVAKRHMARAALACGILLLALGSAARAYNAPEARFRGAPTYDLAVTNVKWGAATKDYSYVTFDLYWSFSWRASWSEPAEKSVTGEPLTVESWDAAWVFVKFLPEKDTKESVERNHWRHATLDTDALHHGMPAGATNTVGLTGDGSRGLGVFVYRDAIGHGANNFKGVKLRWQHGADKVDPARAAVRVNTIAMVYVPEGPFSVGCGGETHIPRFVDGPTTPVTATRADPTGGLTDGSWRGGPVIPFLLDAEWNGPAKEGSRARRIGPVAGQLWGTLTYIERMVSGSSAGVTGTLNDDYPTGYDASYFMKYPLTQGQYAAFLNSLPPDVAAARAFAESVDGRDPEGGSAGPVEVTLDLGPGYQPVVEELDGYTIYSSADLPEKVPSAEDAGGALDEALGDGMDGLIADVMVDGKEKPKAPPVYAARLPFRKCNYLSTPDYFSYAVWAGLRPMSELEYEKACRGVIRPVPNEKVWGTTNGYIHGGGGVAASLLDVGLPTERYARGKSSNGNYFVATRVGWSATADSDRGAAGASYWGILELYDAHVVPVGDGNRKWRAFRGTPGDGRAPGGKPGAPIRRGRGPVFDTVPSDWPDPVACGMKGGGLTGGTVGDRGWVGGEHMAGSRHGGNSCRLVGPRIRTGASPRQGGTAARSAPGGARPAKAPAVARRADTVKVTNVKWEAGTKDYSTVTFDLAWENSWRAAWTEPAKKNVTGKPLKIESWDAAWVFVKFRMPDAKDDAHATLALAAGDHRVPAGAALDVGPNDDGERGVGVFIYRGAAGRGPNSFRNVRLRWMHAADKADPAKAKPAVHAIEMVYVPKGPFKSKSPWGRPLTLIDTWDATKPGGYVAANPKEIPLQATWPNGYNAFYCMKHAISQGQYTELLNSVRSSYNDGRYGAGAYWSRAARYDAGLYGINGFSIKYIPGDGIYAADVPGRACNMLSWPDILSYTAWAGLRMPTSLEYEKACRGPREVARAEDAWTAETCAPATGVGRDGVFARTYGNYGASYWGIQGLSLSGSILEWPGLVHNARGIGSSFAGSHGGGTPWAPEDWPWSGFGDGIGMGMWHGMGNIGIWVDPSRLDVINRSWERIDSDRTGRFGARAARTAPDKEALNSPLQMARLPNMRGFDVAIFPLSGGFRNESGKPLKVELATPLPDACFPEGAASRAFTAAPKAVTAFRILTVLTRQTAAGAVRRDRTLPVRIQTRGGEVLAERLVRLSTGNPEDVKPPAIGSLEGGEVALRITNATDRALALAVELPPPPGITLAETTRRVEIAANAEARAAFPVPRQAFANEGACRLSYRVAVAGGAPQDGEAAAELRNESRWWIVRLIKEGPKLETPGPDAGGGPDDLGLDLIIETDRPSDVPEDLFKRPEPPEGWRQAVSGEGVPLGELGPLPSLGSRALAATRVTAPADREAVLGVQHKVKSIGEGPTARPPRLLLRVWLNDKLVHEARPEDEARARAAGKAGGKDKERGKPVRLRAGGNTLLVECRSEEGAPAAPGTISVLFHDARDGKPVSELMFDVVRH